MNRNKRSVAICYFHYETKKNILLDRPVSHYSEIAFLIEKSFTWFLWTRFHIHFDFFVAFSNNLVSKTSNHANQEMTVLRGKVLYDYLEHSKPNLFDEMDIG